MSIYIYILIAFIIGQHILLLLFQAIDMLRKTTGTVTLSIEKNASTTTAATQQNGVLTPTSPPKPIPVTNEKSPSTPSGKTTPSTTPNDTPSNTMQHSPVPNNQSSSVIDKSPAKTAEPTPPPTQSPAPQEDRPPTPPAPLVEDKPLTEQKPQDTPITNGTPSSPPPGMDYLKIYKNILYQIFILFAYV